MWWKEKQHSYRTSKGTRPGALNANQQPKSRIFQGWSHCAFCRIGYWMKGGHYVSPEHHQFQLPSSLSCVMVSQCHVGFPECFPLWHHQSLLSSEGLWVFWETFLNLNSHNVFVAFCSLLCKSKCQCITTCEKRTQNLQQFHKDKCNINHSW